MQGAGGGSSVVKIKGANDLEATVRDTGANDALNVAVVDSSGNQITAFGGSGGTAQNDDSTFTPGTTSLTPVGGEVDDTTPVAATEGRAAAFRMSTRRELYAQIRDAAGNERGLNVNASGQIAVTHGGALAAGTANIGDVDVLTVVGDNADLDSDVGTDNHAVMGLAVPAAGGHVVVPGDVANGLDVDVTRVGGNVAVTGTFWPALQPVEATVRGTPTVVGAAAADAAVSGNPLYMGARAATVDGTPVQHGDAVGLLADLVGRLVIQPYSPPENQFVGYYPQLTANSASHLVAAAGASLQNYLVDVVVSNRSDSAGTLVAIQAATGTVMAAGYAGLSGGGFAHKFGAPPPSGYNQAIQVVCQSADAKGITVYVAGFKGR